MFVLIQLPLPLQYTQEVLPPHTGLRRILGDLCRQATQSHFNNKLHDYPSPDIITNPSTDRIQHYLYTIVHISGINKKQFTIPVIPNNTLYKQYRSR